MPIVVNLDVMMAKRKMSSTELAAYTQVELNTADADALCTLPGVGPHNAQAILDYRAQHGPFAQVEDAAQVPGITQAVVDSWAGQAYVR